MAGLTAWLKEKRSSRERPVTSIVVVAAGSAARMEGVDKILVPLGELPAIVHTLWVFQDCPLVDEVIVVTSQNRADEISRLCRQYRLNKVSKVVLGGKERLDSVRRGVDESRLYPEERSTSTQENLRYSRAILEELGVDPAQRVAIVTSDFHLCRARLMWGGDTAAVPAHLPSTLYFQCLTVNYFIREAFGLAAYFVYGG